jgi:hypothetical protein
MQKTIIKYDFSFIDLFNSSLQKGKKKDTQSSVFFVEAIGFEPMTLCL